MQRIGDDLGAWHRVAAKEKAESIIQLAPPGSNRIVEVGCGTGAVLEALDEAEFGQSYWGCEPDERLCSAIQTDRISRLIEIQPTPFDEAFLDQADFDLGIITHVAEHLLTPAALVAQLLRRCRYVLMEVPIEDNVLGRLRASIKTRMGKPRLDNPSGHVRFFSRETARALVRHSGGRLLADRPYFPMAPVAANADHGYQRLIVEVASASPFIGRRYYEHYALLATKVAYSDWTGPYTPPL
jgi:SAM-dependent methyltransferase